jgi:hypothetical protein
MFHRLITGFLFLSILAACSTVIDLTYDNQPDKIILYADVNPQAGGPRYGMTCRYNTLPRLRIWGDGFIFLDISTYGSTEPALWSGKVSTEQITAVLSYLQQQGFFNKMWKPDGPNPAGTWFYVGADLKSQSVKYESGNLEPDLYKGLISKLKPSLAPFTLDKKPDVRLDQLNIDTLDCMSN